MKKYIISLLYTTVCLLSLTFILTILYYFNIVDDKLKNIFIYLIGIISIFIGSYKYGKISNKKFYINGMLYYTPFLLISFFLSVFLFKNFKLQSLVYYIILLIFSIIANLFNKKEKKDN